MTVTNLVIALSVIGGALFFAYLIQWIQNRFTMEDNKKDKDTETKAAEKGHNGLAG
ncbi:MAG: hypothetical protein JW969_04915 [Spirochaetales bacterium]|nr:hypothetical protein [Spirochaetales bacterium]